MAYRFILFDLDGTLYSSESDLLKEIGRRIQTWLSERLELTWEEAAALRRDYFQRYGTTLSGLLAEQEVDVQDYLTFVHDIPVETYLRPNPGLADMLAALPLRRAVYTNATRTYSWRVLRVLGINDLFERVISTEDAGLRNKLCRDAYEQALSLLRAQGRECIMVEDSARNLRTAKALGLGTVLVTKDGASARIDEHVDVVVTDVLDVGRVVEHLMNAQGDENLAG